jgi:hypothetical protein
MRGSAQLITSLVDQVKKQTMEITKQIGADHNSFSVQVFDHNTHSWKGALSNCCHVKLKPATKVRA